MSTASRIWLLGAAALAPAAVWSAPGPAVAQAGGARFAPPNAPMLLTRTLRRSLPGGAEIVTRRRYRVRFLPEGDGFRLDGALLSAEVDAPEGLSALAELERSRPDSGMFPLRLDGSGRLIGPAGALPVAEVQRAVSSAVRQIGGTALAAAERSEARAFAQQLGSRPAVSSWPSDLFQPASGRTSERRRMSLPGGRSGLVTVAVEVETQTGGRLLKTLTRTVTTDLDGAARSSSEQWTLAAEPG